MTNERDRKVFELFLEKKVPYQREQWKVLELKVGLSQMQMVSEVLWAGQAAVAGGTGPAP